MARKKKKEKATKPTDERRRRDTDGSNPDHLTPTSKDLTKPPGCRDGGQPSPRF